MCIGSMAAKSIPCGSIEDLFFSSFHNRSKGNLREKNLLDYDHYCKCVQARRNFNALRELSNKLLTPAPLQKRIPRNALSRLSGHCHETKLNLNQKTVNL